MNLKGLFKGKGIELGVILGVVRGDIGTFCCGSWLDCLAYRDYMRVC